MLTFGTSWTSHVPNGPNSNQFISIAVDRDGTVWGASGSSNGSGFYRYNGKDWKSFNMQNSVLPTDNYYRVSAGCNGSVWAGSWGWGVVEMPAGSDAVDSARIFGTNVGMQGLAGNPDYVVVGPVLCDARSNHWMSVILARDKNVTVVRRADGTWVTLPVKFSTGPANTLLDDRLVDRQMVVDAAENLWSVIRDDLYRGIFALGNRGGIDDSVETFLNATDGLPSSDVRTIVVDRDNDIWVGTDKGIGIILDPSNPKRSGSIASYKPLDEVGLINTIAVDALNQKWVGTPQGAFLYSQDGTQQLASYTVENTKGKLIDNDVKSIAIDSKTGTVYFGTLNGLASLTTSAVAPVASFSQLHIYPNPYRIPGAGTGGDRIPLTVDGLVANSNLKILSIEGRVVRELGTPGGRIGFWDGRDAEGRDVASGIYIVAAFAEDGSQVASGKVAVVRK
jgi:hypothetical protein